MDGFGFGALWCFTIMWRERGELMRAMWLRVNRGWCKPGLRVMGLVCA